MLISLLLIIAVTVGGLALTYLIDGDEPLIWRLSLGCVIGSAVCGTAAFVIASLFGLSAITAAASVLVALAPAAIFYRREVRTTFQRDWGEAKGRLQGASLSKAASFAIYLFWIVLFVAFFGRAMIEGPQGIFTGASQNLGDLPFHLGAIFSFTEINNFPPVNPSFAGARFSYPFVADVQTAVFVKLGAGLREAMLVQNVAWALSLLVILEKLTTRLTNSSLAGRIAPFILFFSGGLGFFGFFSDYWHQAKGLFAFLGVLPTDFTIGSDDLRWGNSLVVLFITQRSLLLGMPLTLAIVGRLWEVFSSDKTGEEEPFRLTEKTSISLLLSGLIAGLLPLVHLHSLFVLFVIGLFAVILRPVRWRRWALFAAGAAAAALPELIWSLSGSASETTKFIGWHFGWSKGEQNVFWFWFYNTGLFIPLLALGLWRIYETRRSVEGKEIPAGKAGKSSIKKHTAPVNAPALFLFYLPFAFLFVLCNFVRLAPWEWDNIKVLIYWFAGSVPFVAFCLTWLWRKAGWGKAIAALCFVVLTLSGALDVWRTASGQINYKVFDRDAVAVADAIRRQTDPHALFLNAPTYNPAVALSGRQSLMRYTGHLFSHGIDYADREADVKRIYQGGAAADALLAKYNIDYVLVSPEERQTLGANEEYFRKFPVAAESGQYRVYKVR